MPDVYPSDLASRVEQLEGVVAELQALLRARSPLLEASAGWIMRNMSTPSTPTANDVHIYGQNGRLWATSTLGSVALLPQGQAAYVAPITATDAGATYNSTAQTLINQEKTTINDILFNLKNAGLMESSP